MEQISGSVTRLVFRNPETTYTVLRLAPDREVRLKPATQAEPALSTSEKVPAGGHLDAGSRNGADNTTPRQATFLEPDRLPKLITVVGDFATVEVGQQLWVLGEWVDHPYHGRQFRAEKWKVQLPTSLAGMQAYLASGMVRGIGPSLASAIVEHFREATFDVIERQPHRLLEVPGIGESRVRVITEVWREHGAVRDLMAYLQDQELPPSLAVKIYRALGPEAMQVVRADPYRLTEVRGIGFAIADNIALRAGMAVDSPERLAAGVRHVLLGFGEQGHTFAPRGRLLEAATRLLDVPAERVAAATDSLAAAGHLHCEADLGLPDEPVYDGHFHTLETDAARHLLELARHPVSAIAALRASLTDEQIQWVAAAAGQSDLSPEQCTAIRNAVQHKLSVITGGPGTGKTICLRTLVSLLETHGYECVLVSPTGRSAKRLAEATGHEAYTVHRLLRYTGEAFTVDEIEADVVVVDEASMLDLPLARQLLAALRPSTHLVLVGDVDQLPAVGPGTVLQDVIQSGIARITRLTHIFRQAQSSLIVTNAHRLNRGLGLLLPQRDCDFYLFTANSALEAADLIVDLVSQRIPSQFGASLGLLDPLRDVQVLAPMYKGRAGIDRLNARLQAELNPAARDKPERALQRCVFRVGDKVMVTRNDYERDVSNGEIGYVVGIDEEEQKLRVDCEGRLIEYDWVDADDLTLAYAISIHKAQGSEYPAVVIPLLAEHTVMLYRQLLYTAITRARRLCILVGSRRAIDMAIETSRGPNRYSGLAARLQRG